ncbi:MAG: hypothetical protein DA408_08190 [Bacteroidetes bacterium]|nr:MAG: hypothetical protein DA408_08190 [Bacteroidota bacterium]
MKVIIADTSCLIIYHKIGQFKILQETFSDLIEIIGSLGVLIKAKEKGVIKSVRKILALIDKTDFRISQSIREKVLKESGELE